MHSITGLRGNCTDSQGTALYIPSHIHHLSYLFSSTYSLKSVLTYPLRPSTLSPVADLQGGVVTINLKLISSSILEPSKTPFSTKTIAGSFRSAASGRGGSGRGLEGVSEVAEGVSKGVSMGRPKRTSGVVPSGNMDDRPRFKEHSMKRVPVKSSQRRGSLLEQPRSQTKSGNPPVFLHQIYTR